MSKFLDLTGLTTFWTKVKAILDGKIDADGGTATSLTVNTTLTVKSDDTSVVLAPSTDGSASASGSDGGTLLFPYIGQGVSETVALLSDLPTKVSDLANDSGFLTADDLTQLKLGTLSLGATSTAVAAQKADIVKFVQNFGTSMTYRSLGTLYTVTGVSAYVSGGRFIVYIETGTDSSGSTTQSVCYAVAAGNAPTFTLIDADGNYADDSYNYILSALLRA